MRKRKGKTVVEKLAVPKRPIKKCPTFKAKKFKKYCNR
jgi:hypothetical protein